ncbi:Ubiquitin-conjugating enzyme E2 [Spironucleus salmonicida]|uniref:Ubiquitin-conjugating enzyme E2 n=1 Tax=Spironucleus salmonicida TaxID=348837 RepID=V6LCS1_9EUKA|nr:Ubiquitin-conjugating enzyme E2 [Spironucleus salmonicida]|eukprot:EST42280.1 Ubiquitin-conjugating enzyme E2 [Spironucleus salmonicida]
MSSRAQRHLLREYQQLQRDPIPGISVGLLNDSLFSWKILIQGPPDSPFESGLFRAILTFPDDYPDKPPKLKFTSSVFHPNVFTDGAVCISILHAPGDDPNAYEDRSERWLPVHSASSVIVSVQSMLAEPNCESPANVDAAKIFRNDQVEYKKRVKKCVRLSLEDDEE